MKISPGRVNPEHPSSLFRQSLSAAVDSKKGGSNRAGGVTGWQPGVAGGLPAPQSARQQLQTL